MKVELAYGKGSLTVELPDERTTVIEPTYVPGLPDEEGALRNAMRNPVGVGPLRRMVNPRQTVAISVCDITRPMPSATVLPVLLDELAHVPKEQIAILVASGTHRANTAEELDTMLGREVTRRYRVVNHDAFDSAGLKYAGETPQGIPVWLNQAIGSRATSGLPRASLSRTFSPASVVAPRWWPRGLRASTR